MFLQNNPFRNFNSKINLKGASKKLDIEAIKKLKIHQKKAI